MSAFTDATQPSLRPGLPCSVAVALEAMDAASRADCEAALADRDNWSDSRIERTIVSMGLPVRAPSHGQVGHHRRGHCRCS